MSKITINKESITQLWKDNENSRRTLELLFPDVIDDYIHEQDNQATLKNIRILPGTLLTRMSGKKFKIYMLVKDKEYTNHQYRLVNLTNGYVWKSYFQGSTDTISLHDMDMVMRTKVGLTINNFVIYNMGVFKEMILQLLGSSKTRGNIVFNTDNFNEYAQNVQTLTL